MTRGGYHATFLASLAYVAVSVRFGEAAGTQTGAGTGAWTWTTAMLIPQSLLDLLLCPECAAPGLSAADAGIQCAACGRHYAVRNGILDLHPNPTEAAKCEMSAHHVLADNWLDQQIPAPLRHLFDGELGLRLAMELPRCPYRELPAAVESIRRLDEIADDYFELLKWLALKKTDVVAEIGAHTGWSTHHLAARCGHAIATDISHQLELSQVYLDNGIPFDRVYCDMMVFPFRDGVLDMVFGVATIHHSADLTALFGQVRRTLKTGGRGVFFAEPVAGRWDRTAKETFGAEEKAIGVQEHIYTISQYFAAARTAGLRPSVIPLSSLCKDRSRRWPLCRRAALMFLQSGLGYSRVATTRLYPLLLQFYPVIPFPHFALLLEK